MNARKASSSIAVLLTVIVVVSSLTSCGTMRRLGKDLTVTVASPVIALYGGATDGYASAVNVREGFGENAGVEVLALPFTFVYHTIKHALYCGYHAFDALLFPAYGLAELNDYGPEVEPLDIYMGTWFDNDGDDPSGTDPESGESVGR